jgi:ABC-type arginine/histidine transport system permease subunit
MYTWVHRCILGYVDVYRGTPVYIGVYVRIRVYAGVHRQQTARGFVPFS